MPQMFATYRVGVAAEGGEEEGRVAVVGGLVHVHARVRQQQRNDLHVAFLYRH